MQIVLFHDVHERFTMMQRCFRSDPSGPVSARSVCQVDDVKRLFT
jgi:hypothetical protein